MENFAETFLAICRVLAEFNQSKRAYYRRMFWPIMIVCSIPVVLFFLLIIDAKITGWYKDKLIKRGFYHKEHPVDKLEISIADMHKKRKDLNIRRKEKTLSVSLAYTAKKEYTRDARAAESSVKANMQIKKELSGYVIQKISEGEVCLLVRSAGIYQKRDSGEIAESEERDRSFRLDVGYSWERKKNNRWLDEQDKVINNAGQVIAVRGIDEATMALGYDIYIPRASEEELCSMSLTEMLRFCDAENCKVQIRDKGNVFIVSGHPGFTESDLTKTIQEAALQRGIKVKIKGEKRK